MNELIPITCPHCNHTQSEPEGVVSTYCRKCQAHIKVSGFAMKRSTKAPRSTRSINCPHCQETHKVVESALSTICPSCSAHLNMQNYLLSNDAAEKINTMGTVTFRSRGTYHGSEIQASRIVIACSVSARLTAREEAIFEGRGAVQGKLEAPRILVMKKARASALRLVTPLLEVEGKITTRSVRAKKLIILPGGFLDSEKIVCEEVTVQPGGALRGRLFTFEAETRTSTP